jgi:hypothetical protein
VIYREIVPTVVIVRMGESGPGHIGSWRVICIVLCVSDNQKTISLRTNMPNIETISGHVASDAPNPSPPPEPALELVSVDTASPIPEAKQEGMPPAGLTKSEGPTVPPSPPSTPADVAVKKETARESSKSDEASADPGRFAPSSVLVIDIGGTTVKILATGQTEPRKAPSGREFTPARLIETIRSLTHG